MLANGIQQDRFHGIRNGTYGFLCFGQSILAPVTIYPGLLIVAPYTMIREIRQTAIASRLVLFSQTFLFISKLPSIFF